PLPWFYCTTVGAICQPLFMLQRKLFRHLLIDLFVENSLNNIGRILRSTSVLPQELPQRMKHSLRGFSWHNCRNNLVHSNNVLLLFLSHLRNLKHNKYFLSVLVSFPSLYIIDYTT